MHSSVIRSSDYDALAMPTVRTVQQEIAAEENILVDDPILRRALTSVHRDGWSLRQLFEEPRAMLPVVPSRRGPGLVYIFSDSVALVIEQKTGRVRFVLSADDALRILQHDSPELLHGNQWACLRSSAVAA